MERWHRCHLWAALAALLAVPVYAQGCVEVVRHRKGLQGYAYAYSQDSNSLQRGGMHIGIVGGAGAA